MNEQSIIYCRSARDRLELYVRHADGSARYLMAHRFNPMLYRTLRNGKTVRELRLFRPGRGRGGKAIEHSIGQAVKVFDYLRSGDAA